jgi:large subunit ribosomal protein L6
MSRTGKRPIALPEKVKVQVVNGVFQAEGPLGKESVPLNELVKVQVAGGSVQVDRVDDSQAARTMHGTMRSLLVNAIQGVSKGYQSDLEINGVGYRAELSGSKLTLTLGFSHTIEFAVPKGIKVAIDKQTKLSISGSNKLMVGQVAADIRGYKPPEPYKGKGIKYAGEHIIRKVGKAAGAGSAGGK